MKTICFFYMVDYITFLYNLTQCLTGLDSLHIITLQVNLNNFSFHNKFAITKQPNLLAICYI